MNPVVSPAPVGRAGHGKSEQQRPAPLIGLAAADAQPRPASGAGGYPLGAEESYMLRLGALAELRRAATRLGEAASALQVAEAAVGDIPQGLDRLRATVTFASRVDDDEGRAEINDTFVSLRDEVMSAGDGASFHGVPLFADADQAGQVPVGGMSDVRSMLAGLDVLQPERLPQVMGVLDAAAQDAGKERQAMRTARGEIDAAAESLGDAASGAHDVANMEARARAVARAISAQPGLALDALRNPRAVAMALFGPSPAEETP